MALIFVPTLGALIGKPSTADTGKKNTLADSEKSVSGETAGFTRRYVHILETALDHPGKVLVGAFSLLIFVQVLYGALGKGVEFFPIVEPDFAKIQVRARGNLSVFEMDRLMGEVESRILQINKEKGEFNAVYLRTGKQRNSQESEDIIGIISLEFVHWQSRRKADQILDEIETRTSDLVGIIVDRRKEEQGPPIGKPVAVELSSRYPELLSPSIEKVVKSFHAIKGLINIEDSRPLPGIDWEMKVDRAQAMKFGASVDGIGRAIQMASTGVKLGGYRPNDADEEIDILVRYPVDYRTINQLDHIRVNTDSGPIPISNFVKRLAKPKTGTIRRTNARRVMAVKADVMEGILAVDKVNELQNLLEIAAIDTRVKITFKGEDEEQRQAKAFLGKAFLVALFIMAIILVTQFNSFYSALLILTSVIMSTIGVFIGLLVTGQPFGIVMSGIGVIALAGIVVNNNIVLIDTYDRLKETASSAREAILKTGAQRLRPVLLTTVTTILGLLPMVSGVNIDFIAREVSVGAPSMQWWSQLSTSIVFGLGFATVLTLFVTPCALMIMANFHDWWVRRREGGEVAPTAHFGGS
jgi:multidrug efflux pump